MNGIRKIQRIKYGGWIIMIEEERWFLVLIR
jgi:hypothetical protein